MMLFQSSSNQFGRKTFRINSDQKPYALNPNPYILNLGLSARAWNSHLSTANLYSFQDFFQPSSLGFRVSGTSKDSTAGDFTEFVRV